MSAAPVKVTCSYEEGTKSEGIWRCPNAATVSFTLFGETLHSCAGHAREFAAVCDR